MNSNILRILLVFISFYFVQQVPAQDIQGSIKGYIYNPDNDPSEYSTAVLMNQDSVFVGGTMSQSDGSFVLDNVKPGSYFVMIRNIEFQTHVSDLITINGNESYSLDNINLKTKLTALDEVIVKGEKAILEVHPDKMVFNVANSISSSGNNGLELLSKSPGVLVDMDKNISLQGKAGVKIYINGRPSRLSGTDLSNMLETMRSDNIESIEIISNPSAKYEAEGSGGIINIILKKNAAAGFNGNLMSSYVKGFYDRKNLGTTMNYSGGKLNVFTSINFADATYLDDLNKTTYQSNYLLDMLSTSRNNRKGVNFSGGVDYSFSNEHALSFDARVMVNDRYNALTSSTIISDENNFLPTEILKSEAIENIPSSNYNTNLHYSFVPNGSSSFTADLSYGLYSNTSNTSQPNAYYAANGVDILRKVESEFNTNTDIELFSAKLDYEKRLSKITVSAGAKYSDINTTNSLTHYNINEGVSVLNTNRSNDFSYLEKIAAAYLILDAKASDKISLSAGLRVENTSSLGELESAVPSNDDIVARNYTSYFPNVGLSYNDEKTHAISLSIGRRISRPNYQYLNPFESFMSEISSWKGNPFLNPNYITNYQVSYSLKRKLVISNTYSVTHDFFATIFELVDDKSSVLIPRNMDRVTNNGLSVSYPLSVTDWWQFSSFLIYNHEKYDGEMEGTVIDLTADIYSFRMQNNLKLPLDILMEISYFYRSPWIWRGTIDVDAFYALNLGIKREFANKRLLVQLTANDILKTSSDYYFRSNYGGMVIDGVRSFDNRRLGINVSYKFGQGKAKSSSRKKSAIDDELNRISD